MTDDKTILNGAVVIDCSDKDATIAALREEVERLTIDSFGMKSALSNQMQMVRQLKEMNHNLRSRLAVAEGKVEKAIEYLHGTSTMYMRREVLLKILNK